MALTVLVTGVTGVLGSRIARVLRDAGHRVIGAGRLPGEDDLMWDVTTRSGPILNSVPDVVVHAAAKIGRWGDRVGVADALLETNLVGSLRVAEWCVAHSVERLIYISGGVVYGEWKDVPPDEKVLPKPWRAGAYAVSKWCGEQVVLLARQEGCETSVLRLSSLYGPGYSRGLIPGLLQQGRTEGAIHIFPPIDDAFDLLHVDDAARAVRAAVESEDTGIWNIGGGALISLKEIAIECARVARVPLVVDESAVSGRTGRVLNWVDDQRARWELGHTNRVALVEGIRQVAEQIGK